MPSYVLEIRVFLTFSVAGACLALPNLTKTRISLGLKASLLGFLGFGPENFGQPPRLLAWFNTYFCHVGKLRKVPAAIITCIRLIYSGNPEILTLGPTLP
jgi:hypothetical protein